MSTKPEGKEVLLPCPFCGAGETRIDRQNMWTGMRNQLVCVHIRHWCEKPARSNLCITANTEEEATAAWNRRAATPSALPAAPKGEAACKSCSSALFVTPKLVVYGSNAAIDALSERLKRLAPQSPAPEAALVDAAAGYFLRAGFDPSGDGTKRWEQVADEFKNDADVVPLYERATLSAGKGAA